MGMDDKRESEKPLVALESMWTRKMEGRVTGDQAVTFQSCHLSAKP